MLLTIHITLGLLSVAGSTALFIRARQRVSTQTLLNGAIALTSATVLTGVGLIFQGGSVLRVCAEAVALVAITSGATYYALSTNKEFARERN